MAIHMFQQLIDTLKKSPKRIVFTEGTDARILEASARLLAGTWLAPILIGNEAEVKAAARGGRLQHPGCRDHRPRHLSRHGQDGGGDGGAAPRQDDRRRVPAPP